MNRTELGELIIGDSLALRGLREDILRAAPLRAPVLITGPTGSGKELVAQGLHMFSGRIGRFVPFNAAAIPESLFESQLLGHVRGAFSGAVHNRAGLLRSAQHGTAFMDEIADLPATGQAKLLRVLDGGEILPVGSDVVDKSDFRLVAATNANLRDAVQCGRFRSDLLYRLSGLVIKVPPLRNHAGDIPLLARHFVTITALEFRLPLLALTSGAIRRLERHSWPGNIRELRQTMEHSAFLASGGTITEEHITRAIVWNDDLDDAPKHAAGDIASDEERQQFLGLLAIHHGDVRAVADALGIDRSTAYRRMQRLGLTGASRPPHTTRRPDDDTTWNGDAANV